MSTRLQNGLLMAIAVITLAFAMEGKPRRSKLLYYVSNEKLLVLNLSIRKVDIIYEGEYFTLGPLERRSLGIAGPEIPRNRIVVYKNLTGYNFIQPLEEYLLSDICLFYSETRTQLKNRSEHYVVKHRSSE